jgi:adenosylmethionine-8-amino-7-oxononanoate aminotransferase
MIRRHGSRICQASPSNSLLSTTTAELMAGRTVFSTCTICLLSRSRLVPQSPNGSLHETPELQPFCPVHPRMAVSSRTTEPASLTPQMLAAWDREHVWHAFTQMAEYEPLLIERGDGVFLIDAAGHRYIDGSASMWCNIHGHCHPRLDAALTRQLSKVAHTTNLGLSNPTTVELARRLVEITPAGLEKVFFSGDGSSATEAALKIAFQYWRQCDGAGEQPRTSFVALGEAYHGDTLGAIGVGGVDRFTSIFAPLTFQAIRVPTPGLPAGPSPTADGGPRTDPSSQTATAAETLDRLERLFCKQGTTIAAVIMEPLVQAAGGILVHPPGFLAAVRALTNRHGILLILDEIAVGFGRTGSMFACEQEGVSPDLLCLGKGLTAGYLPMAATLATDTIWQAFLGSHSDGRAFYHGHTFGGNPLAAAVALESLNLFEEDDLIARLQPKIQHLSSRLQQLAELPHVGGIRQRGLMAGIDLVADKETGRPYPWQAATGTRACLAARKHGALLRQLGDTVVIMPPLSITCTELDSLADAAVAGIVAATSDR